MLLFVRLADRVTETARRACVWSSTRAGLGALFLVGLLIRIVLAQGSGGFPFDMSSFAGWAQRLLDVGPWAFYGDDSFADYPPGYLYVLYGLGGLAKATGMGAPSVFLLKLPPILADLGVAWIVGLLAVRLAPAGRRIPVRGPAVAAILLNPAVFFVSAVWGQVDAVLALLVAASFLAFGTGEATFKREAAGMALLAVAVATKPQALFVLPVVVLLLVYRHLAARSDEGGVTGGVGRIAGVGAVGALAGLVVLAPFRLWPASALAFYSEAASTYSVTSVFAFNLWGVVGFWRPDLGTDAATILGVPAFFVGLALFAVAAALVLYRAWSALRDGQHEGRVLVFGGAAIVLVAFATLTRIHERYLFLAVVLLAALVAFRWIRWALVALSALYLINVFFPYVYYLEFVGRPAPKLGGLFDVFYGTDLAGWRLQILSVVITVVCLLVAWMGWRRLEATPSSPGMSSLDAPAIGGEDLFEEVPAEEAPPPPPPWSLTLHPIGRRRALLALGVFALALATRLPGLGSPSGMYFDEVYYARTGAEYVAGKEVYEWTHPPVAKEAIAASLVGLSGFGRAGSGPLPTGVGPPLVGIGTDVAAWTRPRGQSGALVPARLSGDCELVASGEGRRLDLRPDVVSGGEDHVLVAGREDRGPVLARFDGRREVWRVPLLDRAEEVVALDGGAYVLTRSGSLVWVSEDGGSDDVAIEVEAIASDGEEVWASFPDRGRVASWDRGGERVGVVEVAGAPGPIAAVHDRVVVADVDAPFLHVIDSEASSIQERLEVGADHVQAISETGLVWAVEDRTARVLEPRGASEVGSVVLPAAPERLTDDGRRLVSISEEATSCVGGRPEFAWRLGSAVAGSAIVALVFLLGLRLFGSLLVGGLAAGFVLVDGLAFTLSRIAMGESYVVAFILAAWLATLSGLYVSRRADPSRWGVVGWFALAGVVAGLALATKWIGLYAFVGIGVLLLWDGLSRHRDGVFGLAGHPVTSIGVLAGLFGVVPLAVYVATYLPYFALGHSFGDLVGLQREMFSYHANLTADHPFGSSWFGWPFGYRAVFLFLADHGGGSRSEIWTVPNLVVILGGLVAMGIVARSAWQRRNLALGVVLLAASVQYLPWVAVGRVTFLYHYLPIVPFLALALAWALVEWVPDHRRRLAIAGATGAAVVFFLAVLPVLAGWSMPVGYLDAVRSALPWVIP